MELPEVDFRSPEAIVAMAAAALAVVEKIFKPLSLLYKFAKPQLGNLKNKLPWIGMKEMKRQMAELVECVAGISQKVDKIAYQTEHNAGGSMRDDISYVRKEVELLSASTMSSMEMMEDGLFRCSSTGLFFLVNGPFANMLGVTREQLMDHEWTRWFKDVSFQDQMMRAMELGTTFSGETELVDIDGQDVRVRVKLVKFMGSDFEGRVVKL